MAFSHTKPASVQVNQLQFNSDPNGGATVPLAVGLSYNRFQKPQPIVIQKLGAQPVDGHQAQAFQFTNVSSDSMMQAMQMAKRDLKQKRVEESIQSTTNATKNISKQCTEKGKRRRAQPTCASKKNVPTQIQSQRPRPNIAAMPVAPHSPPVRDSDPHRRPMSQDDCMIAEIHRLHQQIGTCIHQIQRLQQAAAVDARVRRQSTKVYAEDIEEDRKRQMRAEEQTTRSGRNIYQLSQQVKELQHHINSLSFGNIKPTKKSQVYSRLASTQRAAIRALQAFVQHMPDFDVARKGMPASYAELGLLVEQLSLCCSQLGVAGLSGVPHSVLNLETSFMSEVGQTSPRSPPRLCQLPKKKSPSSRCLDFETQDNRGPFIKESIRQKENKPVKTKQKSLKLNKPRPFVQTKHSSPNRTAALQAGVAALVRAASPTLSPRSLRRPLSPPRSPTVYFVPSLNLPKSPRSPRSRSVLERKRPGMFKKHNVFAGTKPSQIGVPAISTHFTAPTFSSRAKQIDPHEWPVTDSPVVRRSRSPHRSYSAPSSPRISPSRSSPRQSAQSRLNQSILRDAWLEKQTKKDKKELNSLRLKETMKLDTWRRKLGSQHQIVSDAEREIRSKLQPILNKAEDISAKFAFLQGCRTTSSSSSSSSENEVHASMNADFLSDMLVNELLNETIGDIDEVTADGQAEEIALAMKQAPDIEALMDRLAQMECEQNEVRRRWATIVYQDADTGQALLTKCTDDERFGNPGSPAPLEIVPIRADMKPSFSTLDSKPNFTHLSENAIVFTKPKENAIASSALVFSEVEGVVTAQNETSIATAPDKATRLFMSKDAVLNIQKNKADYEAFLRKTTQADQGKFKPWQLMEEIAEKILDDCCSDIVVEIDQINSEIVDRVYGAEFDHVPEKTGLDGCIG